MTVSGLPRYAGNHKYSRWLYKVSGYDDATCIQRTSWRRGPGTHLNLKLVSSYPTDIVQLQYFCLLEPFNIKLVDISYLCFLLLWFK